MSGVVFDARHTNHLRLLNMWGVYPYTRDDYQPVSFPPSLRHYGSRGTLGTKKSHENI